MTDTAARLAGPVALTATPTTAYTVPAGTQTILRSIHAINPSDTVEAMFTLSLGTDDAATQLFHCTIPVLGTLDWSGFMVMSTAEVLQAAALDGAVTLTVSGIQVTA